jgi:hypothetical protein
MVQKGARDLPGEAGRDEAVDCVWLGRLGDVVIEPGVA